jgi:hypothetical protein
MVMPGSQDQVSAFRHNAENTRQFGRIKAVAVGNLHLRLEPDFGIAAAAFDVNMARFARHAFIRIKVIAQAAITEDDRHFGPLVPTRLV